MTEMKSGEAGSNTMFFETVPETLLLQTQEQESEVNLNPQDLKTEEKVDQLESQTSNKDTFTLESKLIESNRSNNKRGNYMNEHQETPGPGFKAIQERREVNISGVGPELYEIQDDHNDNLAMTEREICQSIMEIGRRSLFFQSDFLLELEETLQIQFVEIKEMNVEIRKLKTPFLYISFFVTTLDKLLLGILSGHVGNIPNQNVIFNFFI